MNLLFKLFVFSCIAVFMPMQSFSQAEAAIPEGLKLSFNGKFVSDIPEGFRQVSENGRFRASYSIGRVSDGIREFLDFRLFDGNKLLFSWEMFPGSDLLISNEGYLAVFDMRYHFNNEAGILLFDSSGELMYSNSFHYASLFGFSPRSGYFVVGTGDALHVINTHNSESYQLAHSSQFGFSDDESILATAKEGQIRIYRDFELLSTIETGFFYPRAVAVNHDGSKVAVIDKHRQLTFSTSDFQLLNEEAIQNHQVYRDLRFSGDYLMAGIHQKDKTSSRGILRITDTNGELIRESVKAEKIMEAVTNDSHPEKKTGLYESIPWPFVPFDEMHTVWNYYEQHMGNGWDNWSYLHQGLDIITPIDEPTFAVQSGYVKCVLTLGGPAYWRVAISPEQVAGNSDGWLYAHLVEGSIQVETGDYVNLHDYLGDIIYWSDDWGHIHFVEINDNGLIWYYDDDEWGINFNPLLALTPNNDTIAPVIEEFSPNSKFGFLVHGSQATFLDPQNLYGKIDIIAKITDFHGTSLWELPAYETHYWVKSLQTNEIVFPRTLGRRLNHAYPFYSSGTYQNYAPMIYHKDNIHLPPSWMSLTRNYYQVLTRNNGDTLIHLNDQYYYFATTDFYDGNYLILIEALDEVGNATLDSMQVYFNNGNISGIESGLQNPRPYCFPNPASSELHIWYFINSGAGANVLRIYSSAMVLKKELVLKDFLPGWNAVAVDVSNLAAGIYFYQMADGNSKPGTFIIAR
jgi:hypothetical protein